MRGSALRALTCSLGLLLGPSSALRADVLEPLDFSALAPTLAPTAPATFVINTGDDAACTPAGPSLAVSGGAVFCGAVDDQGGNADYLGGDCLPGSGCQGIPEIAVFSFEVIGGTLVSAQALTNQADATLDAIHATLDFAGSGLANFGSLNLIETNVSGAVANALGATIGVAGAVSFAGPVSGSGAFAGDAGTVFFNGGFAPGDSAAIVALEGHASFGAGNTLSVEIGGLTPGTEHDRVDVGGTAMLDGTLALTLISGFTPTPGQSVTLLNHGTRAGEFASIAGVQQAGSLDLALRYGAAAATLTAARRGDVNLDGSVDAADVAIVLANLGTVTTAYDSGDVDGSGTVNTVDREIVYSAGAPEIPVLAPVALLLLALLLSATGLARARSAAAGRLVGIVLAIAAIATPPRTAADGLDPLAFTSLGPSLTLLSGSLVINTGDVPACAGPSLVVNGGTAVCGAVDDQGGSADYLGGVWVPGSLGIPEIAVFTFDEIDLQSGTVTVTGTRALALLSRGDGSINTTIALDATPVTPGVAGSPGPGGFRGGLGAESGHGPGGGAGGTSGLSWIGSGGFGASATETGGGLAYGDLSQVLQGGSGGGGLSYPTDPLTPLLGGGGGGGALEVGARGLLMLGPNGRLRAEGTTGAVVNTLGGYAAPGSGGGIRAHGHPLLLQPGARILADVSPGLGLNWSPTFSYSAGGRVLIEGRLLQFTAGGSASVSALSADIDTSGSNGSPRGMIDATPDLTLVPSGVSLDLANAPVELQTQGGNAPGVRLRYRNMRVSPGATVSVPANHRNRADLWLDSRTDPPTDPPTARVIGAGPLVNERTIHGSGTIEVTLQNAAGATLAAGKSDLLRLDGPANTNAGEIDLIGGTLRFTTTLSNDAGGELNLIDATLDCASPLVGAGALRAIDSTVGASCAPPGP